MSLQDIKPEYLNIARRLQSVCRANAGVAIVTMRIIIDETGAVKFWSTPKTTLLEPKSAKDEILRLLTED